MNAPLTPGMVKDLNVPAYVKHVSLIAWVGDMVALGSLGPQELLGWLQKLCHDLMCLAQGAAPRYFLPAHLPPAPRLAVLLRWSQALNQEMRVAEHPFQPALTVQALVVQARSVLHSKN